MLGSGWGELGSEKAVSARNSTGHRAVRVALSVPAVCFVYCHYLYCCYSSLLFAVLLNCPYPNPPVFAFFFSILLPTPAGGGAAERPRGPFVAGHSQTITLGHLHYPVNQMLLLEGTKENRQKRVALNCPK